METTELLKKVRQIEIKTRGLSRNIFAGQYRIFTFQTGDNELLMFNNHIK